MKTGFRPVGLVLAAAALTWLAAGCGRRQRFRAVGPGALTLGIVPTTVVPEAPLPADGPFYRLCLGVARRLRAGSWPGGPAFSTDTGEVARARLIAVTRSGARIALGAWGPPGWWTGPPEPLPAVPPLEPRGAAAVELARPTRETTTECFSAPGRAERPGDVVVRFELATDAPLWVSKLWWWSGGYGGFFGGLQAPGEGGRTSR